MIRERILRLHINDDALAFKDDAEITAFQNAIGKIVSFGMRGDRATGLEFVEVCVGKERDIMAALYPPMAWISTGTAEQIAPFLALSTAIEPFAQEVPRVLSATLAKPNEYIYRD